MTSALCGGGSSGGGGGSSPSPGPSETKPTISSITPATVSQGATVTIVGTNLSPNPTVTIDTKAATVNKGGSTATKILAQTPTSANIGNNKAVVVTVSSQTANSTVNIIKGVLSDIILYGLFIDAGAGGGAHNEVTPSSGHALF